MPLSLKNRLSPSGSGKRGLGRPSFRPAGSAVSSHMPKLVVVPSSPLRSPFQKPEPMTPQVRL